MRALAQGEDVDRDKRRDVSAETKGECEAMVTSIGPNRREN